MLASALDDASWFLSIGIGCTFSNDALMHHSGFGTTSICGLFISCKLMLTLCKQ